MEYQCLEEKQNLSGSAVLRISLYDFWERVN